MQHMQNDRILRIPSPLLPFYTPSTPTAQQQYWLTRPGSLTEALRQLGQFSLVVISEGAIEAQREDAQLLGVSEKAMLWGRDVLMSVDDQPFIYAHSIAPLSATNAHQGWSALRGQGQHPLATLLYHDIDIQRSSFSWQSVQCPSAVHHSAPFYKNGAPLWARHSRFTRHNQSLIVAEVFLETFWHHPNLTELR